METTLKTERYLNLLRVSSVNLEGSVRGSSANRLVASDIAAALGMVENKSHRCALVVRVGLADAADMGELERHVREQLVEFDWFRNRDMQSSAYRLKLHKVIRCAMGRMVFGDVQSKAEKAVGLGVTRANYYKTWELREKNIFQLILQWSIDGDRALYERLSGRFKVA